MEFKFNTAVSEQDYLDYNQFCLFRSPYGKKQIRNLRIYLLIIFIAAAIYYLFRTGFSLDTIIGIVPLLIFCLLIQAILNKAFYWYLKLHIKTMKKSGKLPFSPQSVMEFYEDGFCETTQYNKTECKYSSVERISIVDNKTIYIHVNNLLSYILPLSCFESKEQYDAFLQFIKTKCTDINFY